LADSDSSWRGFGEQLAKVGDPQTYMAIKQALDDAGGVVARAAERLRIRRTTLVEKMRKYGMSRREEEGQDDD